MAFPYIPGTSPAGDDPRVFKEYVDRELNRLSQALRRDLIVPTYGGLDWSGYPDTVAPNQELDETPQIIIAFDEVSEIAHADEYDPIKGIDVRPDEHSIVSLNRGMYYVSCDIEAFIEAGRQYVFAVYEDAVPTYIACGEDSSNQTTFASFNMSGILILNKGAVLTVQGSSEDIGTSDFSVVTCNLTVFRIG